MTDDPVAALDQAIRGAKDFTRAVFAMYSGFVDAGFDPPAALRLTETWLAETIRGGGAS